MGRKSSAACCTTAVSRLPSHREDKYVFPSANGRVPGGEIVRDELPVRRQADPGCVGRIVPCERLEDAHGSIRNRYGSDLAGIVGLGEEHEDMPAIRRPSGGLHCAGVIARSGLGLKKYAGWAGRIPQSDKPQLPSLGFLIPPRVRYLPIV